MKKWICKTCGYTHYGEEAPEICPVCGTSKSQFNEDQKRTWNLSAFVIIFLLLTLLLLSIFACSSQVTVDNSMVKSLDLNRYLGKWYEVARFDHRFERGMAQCTAVYEMHDNGTITVTNRGVKNGEWKTSVGKGKTTDTPGLLRVSFFGPFYSDYRIMAVASDYSYALVGGSNDNYLWILSRSPQLKPDTKDQLIREARRRGYQTDNLIWVEQK